MVYVCTVAWSFFIGHMYNATKANAESSSGLASLGSSEIYTSSGCIVRYYSHFLNSPEYSFRAESAIDWPISASRVFRWWVVACWPLHSPRADRATGFPVALALSNAALFSVSARSGPPPTLQGGSEAGSAPRDILFALVASAITASTTSRILAHLGFPNLDRLICPSTCVIRSWGLVTTSLAWWSVRMVHFSAASIARPCLFGRRFVFLFFRVFLFGACFVWFFVHVRCSFRPA